MFDKNAIYWVFECEVLEYEQKNPQWFLESEIIQKMIKRTLINQIPAKEMRLKMVIKPETKALKMGKMVIVR